MMKEPKDAGGLKRRKADTLTIEYRMLEVKKAFLEGGHRQDIIQLCAEHFGIDERQADNYIARAREEITAEVKTLGLINLPWHIAARMHLFNKAARINDLSNARQILDSLAKLQGLMVDKSELVGADGQPIPATRVLVTFVDPGDGAQVVGSGEAISIDPDQVVGQKEDDVF